MVRSAIAISLLSLGAVLSGSPGLEPGAGVPMQGMTDHPVLTTYLSGRFCFSTPLWRENNLLVERVSASFTGKTTMKSFLYLSVGENETDNIKSGNEAMAVVLKKRAPAGLVGYVERTPGVDHGLNAQRSGLSALTKWGAFTYAER